jgi:hypothetical protein
LSIKIIEDEVHRFLSAAEAEVLCITGHWGVGKTFAWNHYLKNAHEKKAIALKHYSYVSLFGVNSLDDLKYSIFENTVNSSDIGIEPSLETLQSNTAAAAKRFGRKSLSFLQGIPLVKNYVGGLGPIWFLSVTKTIVCLDDVERRGKALHIRDVLGLVSSLKEQKACKVCLILNDEAIQSDKEKEEFKTYLDKVVDTSLKFEPSANEAVAIALTTDPTARMLAEACVKLDISNIRLIKRIDRCVGRIAPLLKDLNQEVLRQAVHSLALFAWSVYEPSRAPSLEYLQKRRGLSHLLKEETVSEREAAWNALLDAYRFTGMDEFDLVLLNGVQNGFFDTAGVQRYASQLEAQIKAATADKSFWRAWEMFHGSFDNNEQDVLDSIYESFMKGIQGISPMNLSATVILFKQLGKPEQAADMLRSYIKSHANERELFNLRNYPFTSDINDPDVVRTFNEKYTALESKRDAVAILRSIIDTNSWNPEDITALSQAPVDMYYNMLKNHTGTELRKLLDACLQFDRIGNATSEMKEVSRRAKDALIRIGRESKINARRVRRYGIEIDPVDSGR